MLWALFVTFRKSAWPIQSRSEGRIAVLKTAFAKLFSMDELDKTIRSFYGKVFRANNP
jgi:hypothetical protein